MLGESEDLSQRADNNDLAVATLLAGADFNSLDERPDDLHSLRTCRLIVQYPLQPGDFSAVKVRKIGMDGDLHVALLGLQVGGDLAFPSL